MWASGDVGMAVGFASLTATPLPRRTTTTPPTPGSCAPTCGQRSALPSPGAGPLPSPLPTEQGRRAAWRPLRRAGHRCVGGFLSLAPVSSMFTQMDGAEAVLSLNPARLAPWRPPALEQPPIFTPLQASATTMRGQLACVTWAFLCRGP